MDKSKFKFLHFKVHEFRHLNIFFKGVYLERILRRKQFLWKKGVEIRALDVYKLYERSQSESGVRRSN